MSDYTFVRFILRHEDGSASRVVSDNYPENPRRDYDHESVMVGTNREFHGPDHGDDQSHEHYVLRTAIDRWDDETMIGRYLRAFHCAEAFEVRHVTGSSQSDWNTIYGAVFPGHEYGDAVAGLKAELDEYADYFAGDVYYIETAPADVVATLLDDDLEPDWDAIFHDGGVETVYGYITSKDNDLKEYAAEQAGSPVVETIYV